MIAAAAPQRHAPGQRRLRSSFTTRASGSVSIRRLAAPAPRNRRSAWLGSPAIARPSPGPAIARTRLAGAEVELLGVIDEQVVEALRDPRPLADQPQRLAARGRRHPGLPPRRASARGSG